MAQKPSEVRLSCAAQAARDVKQAKLIHPQCNWHLHPWLLAALKKLEDKLGIRAAHPKS